MQVASLELCRTLFELSGWEDTHWVYQSPQIDNLFPREQAKGMGFGYPNLSAYDAGYLLRKLPTTITETKDHGIVLEWSIIGRVGWLQLQKNKLKDLSSKDMRARWFATYDDNKGHSILNGVANTPEDAACKLCCELIRQGVLKP